MRAARSSWQPAVAAALALLLNACSEEPAADPATASARPHLLLVSIDSLRADHLGCYGYARDTSPTIDRLAAEGVRFATVASPTSWTLPAHATLFTALPPEGHGLRVDATALSDDAVTLAEVLAEQGYATAAFVGGPFLRSMYGLDQGFERYDESVVRSFRESQRGSTSPRLVGAVQAWLDERAAAGDERPFFVFLHLWDVHYDYVPPPPFDTLFDPDYAGHVTGEDFEVGRQVRADMQPADLAHVVALYDGEIRYTDEHLGRLLHDLDRRGLAEHTLVAVTADHGEEFFEHGAKGHRKNLFDPTLLVPLVLWQPSALPAGRVVDAPVRLQDVPPTLLSLLGIAPTFRFGFAAEDALTAPYDLSAVVRGEAEPLSLPSFGDLEGRLASLRDGDLKLVRERDLEGNLTERLYRRDAGAWERTDEDGATTAAGRSLAERLTDWQRAWARRRPPSVTIELSDEQQAALRELGYLR